MHIWKLTSHMRQTKQPKFREAPRPAAPPLLVWRDTTSYSRDRERIATTWTITLQPGFSVTVTKGHIYYPGQWVMHCEPWFNTRPIEAESEERANAIAIDLIAQKI